MKFLDAKKKSAQENKMQPGTRPDQKTKSVREEYDAATKGSPIRPPDHDKVTSPASLAPHLVALADSLHVDVTKVKGTGQNNAITAKDIRNAKTDADEAFKDK